MGTGILYIVATPIGNLKDITYRAVETLKKVDLIVCEDTRTSKKLLNNYEIDTPVWSFYRNIRKGGAVKPVPKLESILEELQIGKNVALITDAGTPGISDPGNQLVEIVINNEIAVVPVPGSSALISLASISGIDLSKFIFLGFPPHKKGRETFFKKVLTLKYPVIYYESPHRLIKNLELLKKLQSIKNIILGRELTKIFEEVVRGTAEEILIYFDKHQDKVKGEIVIIIY